MNQSVRPIQGMPVITISTSDSHLKMALHAFRKVSSRDEALAVAEKHKPYMLESDIKQMRKEFRNLPYQKT